MTEQGILENDMIQTTTDRLYTAKRARGNTLIFFSKMQLNGTHSTMTSEQTSLQKKMCMSLQHNRSENIF